MPELHLTLPFSPIETGSSITIFGVILVLAAVIPTAFLRCFITTGEKKPGREGRSMHEPIHTVETSELIGSPITRISDFN